MRLQRSLLRRPCHDFPQRRLPHSPAQRGSQPCCKCPQRGVYRCLCRASPSATEWWSSSLIHKQGRRSSPRCESEGILEQYGQDAFFDARVFHPFAPTYQRSSLTSLYRQHQNQKRREHGFCVREVERGSFTPLVFTTNGGAALEAATFLKRLASQISDKKNEPYSVVMNFLRCRLSFSVLRSSLLCLQGSRSNRSLNTTCLSQDSLSLVASEGRLNWMITCPWQVPSLFVCLSECICLIALSIF